MIRKSCKDASLRKKEHDKKKTPYLYRNTDQAVVSYCS